MFMTLLNELATPETMIKIYVHVKKLDHFNHTFIEKENTKMRVFCLYMRYKKFPNFYHIKIAISLDQIKIL